MRSWYPRGNRAPIFEAEQFPRKLHVLGAISSVGTVGPLVFAQPGQAWTAERVIVALYDSILPIADAWFGEGDFRVQLDNATAHTAHATVDFTHAAGVDLLFQSASSPDSSRKRTFGAVLPNLTPPRIWPPPVKLGKRGLPDLASPCQIRQTRSA